VVEFDWDDMHPLNKIDKGSLVYRIEPEDIKRIKNLRHRAFLTNYYDPKSSTFGNATRSYVDVYSCSLAGAKVSGHRLLEKYAT